MSSPDPDFARAAQDFKDGGWVAGVLGVLGGLLSVLLSADKQGWIPSIRKMLAGGITGIIMYFALHGVQMNEVLKSVLMCTAGAFSVEWFDIIRNKITNKNVFRKSKN
jgi:ABC-type uncharacterized transport system permease subunit